MNWINYTMSIIQQLMSVIIYAVEWENIEDNYIGSTCQKENERLNRHFSGYKKWLDDPTCSYTSIFKLFQKYGTNCKMVILETCNQEDRKSREQFWIDRMRHRCVNIINPGRPKTRHEISERESEYWKKNKHKKDEKDERYREKNREKIRERDKEYYKNVLGKKIICECGAEITLNSYRKIHKKSKRHIEWQKSRIIFED